MSIQSLQKAFAGATSPVTIDAAFLTTGGANPPTGFDDLIAQAFALGAGTSLQVAYGSGAVGPVSGDTFTISNASLPDGLFGAKQAQTAVTLVFTQSADADAKLSVQIATNMSDWQFKAGFPAMVGYPCNQLLLGQSAFLFTTDPGTMVWPDGGVRKVTMAPGMTFAGTLALSTYAQAILQIAGLTGSAIPNPLVLSGPFDASAVDGTTVLYPVMTLKAPLSASSFTFLLFQATGPYVGFEIDPMPKSVGTDDDDDDDDGEDQPQQSLSYFFGGMVKTTTTPSLALDFTVKLASSGSMVSLMLAPPDGSTTPFTPAAIAEIAGVPSSYIATVPAPLQAFLTNVAFKGLSLTAINSGSSLPVAISSMGVMVGTVSPMNFSLVDDPTSNLKLTIQALDLNWSILNPSSKKPTQQVVLSTAFIIFPNVFTDAQGNPDGLFKVTITQDYTITAGFDGTVSMANLLPAVTGGLVQMPSGISVSFSNVSLMVAPSIKTYSFSFEVDAQVDIITWDGQPLIRLQGMVLSLTASTPQSTTAQPHPSTTYAASFAGLIAVGPIAVNAKVSYKGGDKPVWNLQSALASPVQLGQLVTELFAVTNLDTFLPDFLPQSLVVNTFSVTATISTGTNATSQYSISGSLSWQFTQLPGLPINCTADLALAYDGTQKQGSQFSGSVLGTVSVPAVSGLIVSLGYAFNQPDSPGDSTLWVEWQGIKALYSSDKATITVTLDDWSLGTLLTELIAMLGDPYFTLTAPWDFLNSISLSGLALTFNLKGDGKPLVTGSYKLPAPIDMGFIRIDGLNVNRDATTGKVLISIDGSSPLSSQPEWSPLFDQDGGQDVQNMPAVPGRGNALFDLRMLALGQHVTINTANMSSIQQVIQSMEALPGTLSSPGSTNPVDPNSTAAGQPRYDAASGWLVAIDLGLLGVKTGDAYTYTVDLMVVFNDPNLYGLRLALNGEKAKALAGLSIDIMYKKVTETIGVYQLDFTFPNAIRQLNFGAVNVTLPTIGVEIYTNGDFLIDLGFPYNLDFSVSFTVQAIIMGVPVMGSGGLYFGKLSNATATNLPVTNQGTFDPVIVFGLGMQVGLGYSIDKGILSAGFSVTFFGIVEGVIAPWHPYSGQSSGGKDVVQGDYYFWLRGQFGILGKLYGSVNFAIISASVNVQIQLVAQITYQSFRAIPLSVSASVSVSVRVKVDLGLFSFHISFSFSTTISENMTIGSDSAAPWDDAAFAVAAIRPLRRSGRAAHRELMATTCALAFAPFPPAKAAGAPTQPPTLTIVLAPQFTVLAPDVAKMALADQQGAFVALMAMDSPTADGGGNESGSSFASLCALLLPWVIASHPSTPHADQGPGALDDTPVDIATLQSILNTLADPASQPALKWSDIAQFLSSSFTVNLVTNPDADQQAALQAGAVLFPAMPGLTITVPDPADTTKTVDIPLSDWATVTPSYRQALIEMFDKVAASVSAPGGGTAKVRLAVGDDAPEALVQVLFEDGFNLISRQLLQAAIDSYDSFPYALQAGDSLQSIMDYAQGGADGGDNPHFTFADLINGNLSAPLAAGNTLTLAGITYAVQSGDSLSSIAALYSDNAVPARFTTTPAALITANGGATNLIQAGVTVTNGDDIYVTMAGDSFLSIAGGLNISLADLGGLTGLYGRTDLLMPSVSMAVPAIAYETAAGDTLGGVFSRFSTTTDAFLLSPGNLTKSGIFDASKPSLIYLSNLEMLTGIQLSQAVAAGQIVGQTAGIVSRFMLHGLRLPNETGLTLPEGFLYPTGQPGYGVYQLTGQQFPVPAFGADPSYSISLSKDQTSLSWLQINGSTANTSGSLDLGVAAANLQQVLTWAVANGYNPSAMDPSLTMAAEAAVGLSAQQYPAASFAAWATSGIDEIATVTTVTGGAVQAAGGNGGTGQAKPILWQMPSSLLSQIEAQQAALEADGLNLADSIGYLPVLAPVVISTDPATQATIPEEVDQYAFATRIDFNIRKLAQVSGRQTQAATSNTVIPAGQGNTPPVTELAPNAYQLLGAGPSDAVVLKRLLMQMEELGAGMVTGLFVGYTDPTTGQPGLVGHAAGDVYCFITRSNLSTQANPPPMTMAMLRELGGQPGVVNDFVNRPEDVVRLLWEQATVNSTGYTFYYAGLAQGCDLPSGLFDSNGTATLTLVVTYARSATLPLGARVTNCVNSVMTLEAVDTSRASLALVSQSAPATARTEAADSIAALALRYGMTAGTFAGANPTAALTAGARIPVDGVYHQVTQADVASGDIWGTVAAAYSVNLTAPLTPARLQAYNPAITAPALYTVLMIPGITYGVASGDTLASIAGHFGLRVEALGAMAQGVAGLLAVGTINVNPQSFSATPQLGLGNLGVQLTRANPGTPGAATDPDFGEQFMFSLYSLLDAGFAANPFFSATAACAPFGPTQSGPDSGEEAMKLAPQAMLRARARHHADLRHPERRRTMLQAQAALPTQSYEQALSVASSATTNASPAAPGANLPPASANPYVGVGSIAQMHLRWLDLFGNCTVTPFDQPPAGYDGPLNNMPVPVTYADTLIGLSQWPNVSSSYIYSGAAGAPQMAVTFTLNGDGYRASAATAQQDSVVFNQLYFQLNQNYDTLGIPGLSGPAVTLSLTNTLTGDLPQPLDAANSAALVGFVNDCAAFVNAAGSGQAPASAPSVTLTLPIDLSQVAAANVNRLKLDLTLARAERLVDPSLLDTAGGMAVTTEIPAFTTGSTTGEADQPPSDALLTFAQSFEAAFVTTDWQMRVGAAPADPAEPRGNQTFTVWAVRFALGGSCQGMTFTLDESVVFYAPKPVANQLYTGSIALPLYKTGQTFPAGTGAPTTFTGVDLNLWMSEALASIDTFLSPTYATSTFILDALMGNDPDESGYLSQLLDDKESLAQTISGTLLPVLADGTAGTLAAAAETMKQSLLQKLGNAYAVSAVVAVPVTDATTNEALPPGLASPPLFFGSANGVSSAPTPPNYALSTGAIPLNAAGASSTDSALAFTFSCADPSSQASVPLTLQYQLTHLQDDVTAIPGIEGYRQSRWIRFITGPYAFDIGRDETALPVVLRALPQPPLAVAQTGAASPSSGRVTPDQLPDWDYTFTYSAARAAQDSLQATVQFNMPSTGLAKGYKSPTDTLFESLATMISNMPALQADFDAYLRKIDPTTDPTGSEFTNAKMAVAAFTQMVSGLSAAYAAWAAGGSAGAMMLAAQGGPPPVTLSFELVTAEDGDGNAVVEVLWIDGAKAPVPQVWIAGYTAEAYTPDPVPSGLLAAYRYYTMDGERKVYLGFEQALSIEAQTVAVQKVSALSMQSAGTAIEIVRNQELVIGQTTNPLFWFTTPTVEFATPVAPLVTNAAFDMGTLVSNPPAALSTYLTTFFEQMLGTDGGNWVTIQMEARASYPLTGLAGGPTVSVPINMLPPSAATGSPPAFIASVASTVGTWLSANRASLTGIGATLDFKVVVYGSLPGTPLPVVKIEDLSVAVDKVS